MPTPRVRFVYRCSLGGMIHYSSSGTDGSCGERVALMVVQRFTYFAGEVGLCRQRTSVISPLLQGSHC